MTAAQEGQSSRTRSLRRIVWMPVRDTLHGLDASLQSGWSGMLLIFLGLLAGWWIYVPCHELLHALGCVVTGGSISRLEIDGLYGGALLAQVFPFVVSGSEYAGRLSGFDTNGSDLVYFATDFAPFLITLWPGLWALRRAASGGRSLWFGFWIPWAMAPFMSLTGDAYEIGSLITVNLFPRVTDSMRELWIGDDVFRVWRGLSEAGGGFELWLGFSLGIASGLSWAVATYWAADRVATALGQPHKRLPPRAEA